MPDSSKAEWIALLRMQLMQAQEREDRWLLIGTQLRRTNQKIWQNIAELRNAEVQNLRLLLDEAEARQD